MKKKAVIAALTAALNRSLEVIEASARDAHAAATHEEAKPENDKDTRALEAGYLAGAQRARAAELKRALDALAAMQPPDEAPEGPVRPLSLVTLHEESTGQTQRVFLCPYGAGVTLEGPEGPIQVVTLKAPLGAALIDQSVDEEVQVELGGRRRVLTILSIA
ncbi:MAG: GreA/GreB family elongation factor [Myxococcales bacterium]|nr:GreA/GreB family elongation factor [Myxococcales bacterium]